MANRCVPSGTCGGCTSTLSDSVVSWGGGDLRPQVAAREEGGWHELLTGKKHTPRHQATGPQSACRNDSE